MTVAKTGAASRLAFHLKALAAALLVAFACVVASGPLLASEDGEQQDAAMTRGEWLHRLVAAFEMVVDSEEYPDNYFSDLEPSNEYYRDVLVAVEFGVVDVEAGDPVFPDDPASRDFVASTLNYCLGYLLGEGDEIPEIVDLDECSHPIDCIVAAKYGWFALDGGLFHPDEAVAADEADGLLAMAVAEWHSTDFDGVAEADGSFAEGVYEIPRESSVEIDFDGGVVWVYDPDVVISEGQTFAVWSEYGIPYVYEALGCSYVDGVLAVEAELLEDEELYQGLSYQTRIDVGFSGAEAEDGVEAYASFGATDEGRGLSDGKYTATFSYDADGGSFGAKFELSQVKCDVGFKLDEKWLILSGTETFSAFMKTTEGRDSILAGPEVDAWHHNTVLNLSVAMLNKRIAGFGELEIKLVTSIEGSISISNVSDFSVGIKWVKGSGARLVKSFERKDFSVTAQAKMKVGVRISLGASVPLLKAGVMVEAGACGDVTIKTYPLDSPRICIGLGAYAYAEAGVYLYAGTKGDMAKVELKCEIWNSSNSPVRAYVHIEDGVLVPACTRGTAEAKYVTPSTSRYSGVAGLGEASSTGWDYEFDELGNRTGSIVKRKIWDYTLDANGSAVLTTYYGNPSTLVVPHTLDGHPVVSLGSGLFRDNMTLNTVVVSEGIKNIGVGAFSGCTALRTVVLPDTLVVLGFGAFASCTSLDSIDIPASVTSLKQECFEGCSALESLTLPASVAAVDAYCFGDCTSLSRLEVLGSSTRLANQAFNGCTSLRSVTMPCDLAVGSYGVGPFYGCSVEELRYTVGETGSMPDRDFNPYHGPYYLCTLEGACGSTLRSVSFDEGVVHVGARCFYGCTALESVFLPSTLESLGEYCFSDCASLGSVELPGGVSELPMACFAGCTSLTSVPLPVSVETIGSYCFSRCASLGSVELPGGVSVLPEACFAGCTSLTSVSLPASVETVGSSCFDGCTSLSELEVLGSSTGLDHHAFHGCSSLRSVTMPCDLAIGGYGDSYNPFYGCPVEEVRYTAGDTGSMPDRSLVNSGYADSYLRTLEGACGPTLRSVSFDEGVVHVGAWCFSNCTALESVSLPSSLESLGSGCFFGCTSLDSIWLPESISKLPGNCFQGCTALESVSLPTTLESLGGQCFSGCTALESVSLPASVGMVGANCFDGCTSLSKLEILGSSTGLGSTAFHGCSSLCSVTMPCDLAIGGYGGSSNPFYGCPVEEVRYTVGDTGSMPDRFLGGTGSNTYTLEGACRSTLRSVSFDEGVVHVGAYQFVNCYALESVSLPFTLESVGGGAFRGCTSLGSLELPASAVSVESGCFYGCTSLKAVYAHSWEVRGQAAVSVPSPGKAYLVEGGLLYLPDGDCASLIGAYGEPPSELVVPDRVQGVQVLSVATEALAGSTGLTRATLPEGLEAVGVGAFASCPSLEALYVWDQAQYDQAVLSVDDPTVVVLLLRGDISQSVVEVLGSHSYDGTPREPDLSVTLGSRELVRGIDYEVSYSGNVDAGTATVTLTGLWPVEGKIDVSFEIVPADLSGAVVALPEGPIAYDGSAKEPDVTVVLDGKLLVEGTDYQVIYADNVNAGTATVVVTGKGNYRGEASNLFLIERASIGGATVALSQKVFTYDGDAKEPGVSVTLGGRTLVGGADYTVTYSSNVDAGTATVTVTGRGNYAGAVTAAFEILAAHAQDKYAKTPAGYAEMLYNRLIDVRSPTEFQISWWAGELTERDPAQAVASFAASNAFGGMGYTDREAARVLYAAILDNLEPDGFQLDWWEGRVAEVGAVAAAAEMTDSDAFRRAVAEYGLGAGYVPAPEAREYERTPRGYAEMLYNRLIAVASPEAYRLDWWEARLHGTSDPAGVVASFAASNAFGEMGYSPREAARVLYSAVLNNTSPSPAQLDYWEVRVSEVGPVAAAAEMTDSAAFRSAVSEYGLGAGFEPPADRDYDKTPRGYAEMLYNRLISVEHPSENQLGWWQGELSRDGAAAVASFASSNAFGGMGYTDREAARVLYSAILDNLEPNDFQLSYWAGVVSEVGAVRAAALMTDSDAFRAACVEYELGAGPASA